MLKPDCLVRQLENEAFKRIVNSGCHILTSKRLRLSFEDILVMYAYASDKDFFRELTTFLMSSDVVVFLVKYEKGDITAVKHLNRIVGSTNPLQATRGTLRELGNSVCENVAHSSSNSEEVVKSLSHFFTTDELLAVGLKLNCLSHV